MKILVTGADGALGVSVVSCLLAQGAMVAQLCGGMTVDELDDLRFAAGDLSDEVYARDVISRAVRQMGGIDALVHLAGGFTWEKVVGNGLAPWRAMFDVNLATAVASVEAVMPLFAGRGAIVLVGAQSAQPAGPGFGPYAAAKAGVARLVEALAAEGGPNLRVNAVLPAIIDTPRNRSDMPDADPANWTRPEAIAEVIEFLLSDRARAISGASIPVTNSASARA